MKAGRILIASLIGVGLWGAIFTGSSIYSRLLYLGLMVGIGSFIWTRWLGRSIDLQRSARILRANVGDMFEERYDIYNGSRLLAPWAEVENASKLPSSAGSRVLTLLMGKQRRNYIARTWLTKRGAFQLGPTHITVGDPFGLFRLSREFEPKDTLVVLPMLFEVKSFIFPPGLLPGGQVIRRKSSDITPHAAGIREYVHGDAVKRVHWPTSIRRGQLMVKEFEQDPQAEVWLFLDVQRSVHSEKREETKSTPQHEQLLFGRKPKYSLPPSTLEYAVSITASLAHYFLGERRAVGFVSAGQTFTIHPAERSERQESKILETLAFLEANGELSIAALVAIQSSQLPQGSSVVIVTSSTRNDLLIAVDDLQKRFLRPIVVLLDVETFGGESGTEKIHRALLERRVPVVVISCGMQLSQALSEFVSDIRPKDFKTWQTPISLS